MKKHKFLFFSAIFLFILTIGVSQSKAQAAQTWVSGVGDDADPCTRSQPCKTFQGAIVNTAAGGEISALDSGSYGSVTITKSITLNGIGSVTNILNTAVTGINVSAGANDVVIIRNVSINGIKTGISGIVWTSGGRLLVENCSILGVTQNGINANLTTAGSLTIRNTSIKPISGTGIKLATTSGILSAVIDGVQIYKATIGLNVLSNTIATISNSVITQNTGTGILAENNAVVNAEKCEVSHNVTGIQANTGATVRVSNLVILNNTTGIGNGGGIIASFQNNKLAANGTNGAATVNLPNQ